MVYIIYVYQMKFIIIHGMYHCTSIAHWIKNPLRRMSEHNHKYNYLNFSFFHQKKSTFLLTLNIFQNKN